MNIYLDADGPLQNFAQWMVDEGIPLGYNREDTEAEFHKRLKDIFLDSPTSKYCEYFFNLYATMPMAGYDVFVLTAIGDHWKTPEDKLVATKNKLEALQALGFDTHDVIVVDSGSDKIKYATEPDGTANMLYDDKWSTVAKWEAAGGNAFFVPECCLKFKEAGVDHAIATPEKQDD